MPQRIALYQRLTHKWADGWEHLDEHKLVGHAKLLAGRKTSQGNGFDDLGVVVHRAVVPKGMLKATAVRALYDTIHSATTTACQHEHDCCGCQFSTVNVRPIRGRTFSVAIHRQRNF